MPQKRMSICTSRSVGSRRGIVVKASGAVALAAAYALALYMMSAPLCLVTLSIQTIMCSGPMQVFPEVVVSVEPPSRALDPEELLVHAFKVCRRSSVHLPVASLNRRYGHDCAGRHAVLVVLNEVSSGAPPLRDMTNLRTSAE